MLCETLRFPGFLEKAVTLSYDDGNIADRRLVEILNRHGLKCTFNLNSGWIFKTPRDENRIRPEELKSLYLDAGHEIAVHGTQHLSLTDVDSAVATNDILSDRKKWEEITGAPVRGMAYACGRYNDRVVRILEACGIAYARTTQATEKFEMPDDWLRLPATCHHDNPRLMELVERFLNEPYVWKHHPRLFYLWGHSYEFDRKNNWRVIEQFAQEIGEREDVFYATNGELYAYVQAYRRLEYAVDGTTIFNPSALDVYLHLAGKDILVPAGKGARLS